MNRSRIVFLLISVFASSSVHAQLAISGGGTGATTASAAIGNLGLPIVSVVNFGATGDGVTDDTAAIDSAMTSEQQDLWSSPSR